MDKKRVLFIGIGFYDYEKAIIGQFEQLGYDVDYFSEVPANGLKYRLYSRFNNTGELEKIRAKHNIQIANNCAADYDLVFIIKCEYLTVEALEIIKQKIRKLIMSFIYGIRLHGWQILKLNFLSLIKYTLLTGWIVYPMNCLISIRYFLGKNI
jgi:hypothetical protein